MPRRPRIELPGYHHIVNRGVNRSTIFETVEDYEMFLKIISRVRVCQEGATTKVITFIHKCKF